MVTHAIAMFYRIRLENFIACEAIMYSSVRKGYALLLVNKNRDEYEKLPIF